MEKVIEDDKDIVSVDSQGNTIEETQEKEKGEDIDMDIN